MLASNWMALTKLQTEIVSHKVYWCSSLQNICSQKVTLSWLPEAWKRFLFLPRQGFGPEGKTRGGIIVPSTYTYKECGILVWYAIQSRFEETRRARSWLIFSELAMQCCMDNSCSHKFAARGREEAIWWSFISVSSPKNNNKSEGWLSENYY